MPSLSYAYKLITRPLLTLSRQLTREAVVAGLKTRTYKRSLLFEPHCFARDPSMFCRNGTPKTLTTAHKQRPRHQSTTVDLKAVAPFTSQTNPILR